MDFKCNYSEERVDLSYCENDCTDCNGEDGCPQYEEIVRKQGNAEKIKSSELRDKITETFNKTLGINKEQSEQMIGNLLSDIVLFTESNIKEATSILINERIQATFDEKITVKINELFEEALLKEILKIDKDSVTVVKVQEDMEKRIIGFLNSNYDRRRTLDESVDKVIGKIASNKVEEALEEIKKETIEKFNKEVMKKMMTGMATAISDDKRLLTLLEV